MKKIIVSILCVLLICAVLVSCEKDPDNEIKGPGDEQDQSQNVSTDDPNNDYGDLVVPKD